jgi:hypothetical protein
MKDWIFALPLWAQIFVVIVYVFTQAVVIVVAKRGIGGLFSKTIKAGDVIEHQVIIEKHRTLSKKFYEMNALMLSNQMNRLDEFLNHLKLSLLVTYETALSSKIATNNPQYVIQKMLWTELLNGAFDVTRTEFRRLFKENGYHGLENGDWRHWKQSKADRLITIIKSYFLDHYPNDLMLVKLEDRFKNIDNTSHEFLTSWENAMDYCKKQYAHNKEAQLNLLIDFKKQLKETGIPLSTEIHVAGQST